MIFLLTIFAVVLGVFALGVYIKRRFDPQLPSYSRDSINAAETFRPLFAPSETDMREFDREAAGELKRQIIDQERRICEEKLAKFEKFRQTWRISSNRANTIELFYQASQNGSGKLYLEVWEDVLAAWNAGSVADFSADALAQILESHFRLLPANEKTPGVSFRIKEEIAGLRRESEKNK